MQKALTIKIQGAVQGVGFRPFVWRLADSLSLAGSVQNRPDGVVIAVEGDEETLEQFLQQLRQDPPPLARITSMHTAKAAWQGLQGFVIRTSAFGGDFSAHILPDICLCEDCRQELFDPRNRRYRYPFINCTHCGPRFSIIRSLPYDRPATSMSGFKMCPDCAAEYADPADRRYHAQPVACPVCGPAVTAVRSDGTPADQPWEAAWQTALEQGQVAAVKGIGGFHLACSALDEPAAERLRFLKKRENKPFAIMTPDLDWIESVCRVSEVDRRLLTSRARPIVILKIKAAFAALRHIAPGLDTLGVMLPYSPLHELMFASQGPPLVMTSANYSSEPMIHTNRSALSRLAGLADLFLMHNRDIVNRCDDSVTSGAGGRAFVVRPGRGTARFSLGCSCAGSAVAFGADMKNTFAVAHHQRISVSQFIGDLEHPDTQQILLDSLARHLDCFRVAPELVVHDLHPDYFSTRLACQFAAEKKLPTRAVQHHHAHLAAAAFEHRLEGPAIGFALDGTGLGPDGTLWGGEVLHFDRQGFRRVLHLRPVPLPGGDAAVRAPERVLIAYLQAAGLLPAARAAGVRLPEAERIIPMIDSGLNCPLTSSTGRLFDAVACLLGVCRVQTYDGEAAMRLEAAAAGAEDGLLSFSIRNGSVDWGPLFEALIDQLSRGIAPEVLSARFHNTLAEMLFACGEQAEAVHGPLPWVFSGGVFQNRLLVEKVLSHRNAPGRRLLFSACPNDSGIALGQAVVGLNAARQGGSFDNCFENL